MGQTVTLASSKLTAVDTHNNDSCFGGCIHFFVPPYQYTPPRRHLVDHTLERVTLTKIWLTDVNVNYAYCRRIYGHSRQVCTDMNIRSSSIYTSLLLHVVLRRISDIAVFST